jgi:phage/plasmid-like protein (TIGR03299 family)
LNHGSNHFREENTMSANVEKNIAYREGDQVPWHGLGNPLKRGATMKQWLKAGNLDWEVVTAPIHYMVDGKKHTMDNKVLCRVDDPTVTFGTVGPKWTPFQNAEVLEFFREYVDAGDMSLRTAGMLGKGEVVWALAEMERKFDLPGGDSVEGNVLLMNPHQYGKAAVALFTPIVVVCQNTLQMAMRAGQGRVSIPHTREFNERTRTEAKETLGIAREQMEAFEQDANILVEKTMNDEDVQEVLAAVFGKQERVQAKIIELYEGDGMGSTLEARVGTAWGLLNAVTEYYDWHSGREQKTRLKSAWSGHGAVRKRRVLEALLAE